MRKVLLVSNHVFLYRVKVYNYFHQRFKEMGISFSVIAPSVQNPEAVMFPLEIVPYRTLKGRGQLHSAISRQRPDIVICFLHLKDFLLFSLNLQCGWLKIPVIYWNHGIDLSDQDNRLKNFLYYRLHGMASAIILYSEEQIKHVQERNREKIAIAWNTLNFEDARESDIGDMDEVRKRYGIKEDRYILSVGRMNAAKAIENLIGCAGQVGDAAVVIVGPGLTEEQKNQVEALPNVYYLGPIYDDREIHLLFRNARVFTIPYSIGLALNQGLYWGAPVVVMNGRHGPEITYIRDGENGFITETSEDYATRLRQLIEDDLLWSRLRKNAMAMMENQGGIENMFQGFMTAIDMADKKTGARSTR